MKLFQLQTYRIYVTEIVTRIADNDILQHLNLSEFKCIYSDQKQNISKQNIDIGTHSQILGNINYFGNIGIKFTVTGKFSRCLWHVSFALILYITYPVKMASEPKSHIQDSIFYKDWYI